jgi:hypothetical protein
VVDAHTALADDEELDPDLGDGEVRPPLTSWARQWYDSVALRPPASHRQAPHPGPLNGSPLLTFACIAVDHDV